MFDILAIALNLFITPAYAQNVTCATRPSADSSNACASTAFVHNLVTSGGTFTVNNNTQLSAVSTSTTSLIIRYGYSSAGDSPPVVYVSSGSACSLNAGAGDGGSQVPSANGKCWLGQFNGYYNVKQFGAKGNAVADDTTTIQNTLTAAGAAGGGYVFVPAGIYLTAAVLSVPSYTTFTGVGQGGTTIRMTSAPPSKAFCGTTMNAVIGSACTRSVTVSKFTLDLATNSVITNGIQFGEYGAASTMVDGTMEDNEINGLDAHMYLYYVKFANRIKIKNNRGTGIPVGAATQDIACIETFGTDGSEVSGNYCRGVGVGVTVKSQVSITGSDIKNTLVHDNIIDYAMNGIIVSNASGLIFNNVKVYNNIVTNSGNNALQGSFSTGGTSSNIQITNNQFLEASNATVRIDGDYTTNIGLVFTGNTITQANASYGGVIFTDINGLYFAFNTIGALPYYALDISGGSNQTYYGNKITGSSHSAIYTRAGTATPSNIQFIGNTILNYGTGTAGSGIAIDAGDNITMVRNHFMYGAASAAAYAIDAQLSTNSEISANTLGWTTANAVFVNGTGGRNNYNTAIFDRNAYRVSAIFPREVGFGLSNTDILTDDVDSSGNLRLRNSVTPASAVASCSQGQIRWDTSYVYVCIATDTWKRATLATW